MEVYSVCMPLFYQYLGIQISSNASNAIHFLRQSLWKHNSHYYVNICLVATCIICAQLSGISHRAAIYRYTFMQMCVRGSVRRTLTIRSSGRNEFVARPKQNYRESQCVLCKCTMVGGAVWLGFGVPCVRACFHINCSQCTFVWHSNVGVMCQSIKHRLLFRQSACAYLSTFVCGFWYPMFGSSA